MCGFNFEERDAGAKWLKARILEYVKSDEFAPEHDLDERMLKTAARKNRAIKNGIM